MQIADLARPYAPRLRWCVCGLLFFATTINYVDRQVLGLLKRHIHDELVQQMKLTRKPLFAEIASGEDGNVAK